MSHADVQLATDTIARNLNLRAIVEEWHITKEEQRRAFAAGVWAIERHAKRRENWADRLRRLLRTQRREQRAGKSGRW